MCVWRLQYLPCLGPGREEKPQRGHIPHPRLASLSVLATEQHSPGIDEVLGKADVGWGPCDGDLAL